MSLLILRNSLLRTEKSSYTVQVKPEVPGVLYDGPEDAKKIDLAEPGEEPRPAWIATDLTPDDSRRGRIAHLNAKRVS